MAFIHPLTDFTILRHLSMRRDGAQAFPSNMTLEFEKGFIMCIGRVWRGIDFEIFLVPSRVHASRSVSQRKRFGVSL